MSEDTKSLKAHVRVIKPKIVFRMKSELVEPNLDKILLEHQAESRLHEHFYKDLSNNYDKLKKENFDLRVKNETLQNKLLELAPSSQNSTIHLLTEAKFALTQELDAAKSTIKKLENHVTEYIHRNSQLLWDNTELQKDLDRAKSYNKPLLSALEKLTDDYHKLLGEKQDLVKEIASLKDDMVARKMLLSERDHIFP